MCTPFLRVELSVTVLNSYKKQQSLCLWGRISDAPAQSLVWLAMPTDLGQLFEALGYQELAVVEIDNVLV